MKINSIYECQKVAAEHENTPEITLKLAKNSNIVKAKFIIVDDFNLNSFMNVKKSFFHTNNDKKKKKITLEIKLTIDKN